MILVPFAAGGLRGLERGLHRVNPRRREAVAEEHPADDRRAEAQNPAGGEHDVVAAGERRQRAATGRGEVPCARRGGACQHGEA